MPCCGQLPKVGELLFGDFDCDRGLGALLANLEFAEQVGKLGTILFAGQDVASAIERAGIAPDIVVERP